MHTYIHLDIHTYIRIYTVVALDRCLEDSTIYMAPQELHITCISDMQAYLPQRCRNLKNFNGRDSGVTSSRKQL